GDPGGPAGPAPGAPQGDEPAADAEQADDEQDHLVRRGRGTDLLRRERRVGGLDVVADDRRGGEAPGGDEHGRGEPGPEPALRCPAAAGLGGGGGGGGHTTPFCK